MADRIAAIDGVERSWIAESFQDTLLFGEVPSERALPDAAAELLDERGLTGANEAYGIDGTGASDAGNVGDYEQHRFVDTAGQDGSISRASSTQPGTATRRDAVPADRFHDNGSGVSTQTTNRRSVDPPIGDPA